MNGEQEALPNALNAAEDAEVHDVDGWMDEEEDLKSSPLIVAAAVGDLGTVKTLFEQGYPSKNETTNHGSTAILIAAWKGHLSVLRYLAEHGSDWDKSDKWGDSPFHITASTG